MGLAVGAGSKRHVAIGVVVTGLLIGGGIAVLNDGGSRAVPPPDTSSPMAPAPTSPQASSSTDGPRSPAPTPSASPPPSPSPPPLIGTQDQALFLRQRLGLKVDAASLWRDDEDDHTSEDPALAPQGADDATDIIKVVGAIVDYSEEWATGVDAWLSCGTTQLDGSYVGEDFRDRGRLVCATAASAKTRFEAGPTLVVVAELADSVPIEPTHTFYRYAVNLDADGDPANNGGAELPLSPFQGTDFTYELGFAPHKDLFHEALSSGAVEHRAQLSAHSTAAVVAASPTRARALAWDRLVVFLIPIGELEVERPSYRFVAHEYDLVFDPSADTFSPTRSGQGVFALDVAPGAEDGWELARPDVRPPVGPVSTPPTTWGTPSAALFLDGLAEAFRRPDPEWLRLALHHEVIELYGADQCERYVTGLHDETRTYAVRSEDGPGPWEYAADGRSVEISLAVRVVVDATLYGEEHPGEEVYLGYPYSGDQPHQWFTDCGDPLP